MAYIAMGGPFGGGGLLSPRHCSLERKAALPSTPWGGGGRTQSSKSKDYWRKIPPKSSKLKDYRKKEAPFASVWCINTGCKPSIRASRALLTPRQHKSSIYQRLLSACPGATQRPPQIDPVTQLFHRPLALEVRFLIFKEKRPQTIFHRTIRIRVRENVVPLSRP